MKGVYSLIIKLSKAKKIKVGKLGMISFPKGFYVYTGSALNGLEARINRHERKRKKKFWHVDYLLSCKHAKILDVVAIRTEKRLECKLNKIVSSLPKARIAAKGFGCSDCKCKTHLFYFNNKNSIDLSKQSLNLIDK